MSDSFRDRICGAMDADHACTEEDLVCLAESNRKALKDALRRVAELEHASRLFPIQSSRGSPGGHIPWWLAEIAYAAYSEMHGTVQGLERFAERGGFGWDELAMLLSGRPSLWEGPQGCPAGRPGCMGGSGERWELRRVKVLL